VFTNLFSITLSNIEKYFPGIHFPKKNYFPANKWGLSVDYTKCEGGVGKGGVGKVISAYPLI
jgi:hypothetical protein